jgi:apolipoprotein N-acyltransferase
MSQEHASERTLLLRIFGHGAMRVLEAFMLAWLVWFVVDVLLQIGHSETSPSGWFFFLQNGAWEYWEHLFLINDSAVRAGAWWLVLACLVVICFLRYHKPLRDYLEG